MRLTGAAKQKRDRAIRRFALRHPEYTERELGEKFGLSQAAISEIVTGGDNASSKNIRAGS